MKKVTRLPRKPLFTLLSPEQTGINFNNQLTEKPNINVLRYEYFYNGGGVAVGDVNEDGLDDVYFTANMTDNKLYLNKGHMQFEDVTDIAGVAGRPGPVENRCYNGRCKRGWQP
ncbi:MAG: VCBS repeat-containing protein [Segetibacter sp.]